jgi:hypothetical protein
LLSNDLAPFPHLGPSLVSKPDRRYTGRETICCRERGGARSSINHSILSVLNNVFFSRLAAIFLYFPLLNFTPWHSPSEHAQRDPVHDEQQLLLALPRPLPERRHAQVSPYHRAMLQIRDVYPGSRMQKQLQKRAVKKN